MRQPIVAGVTVQEQVVIGVPAKSVRSVDVYDFRRPTTLAREHSRVLELAFETFARQWGTQLTAKVRVVSQVTCEQVLMVTYDEYAASLPSSTAMVLCRLESFAAKAVLQLPISTALGWISYMLGGHGGVPETDRKFTHVEQALVRRIMDDALEDLRYSLGTLLVSPIKVDTFQYNSQFAQAAATTDLMIVATFEIRIGEWASEATVAIPAEALLPQMGDSNPTATAAGARGLMEAQLSWAPVELALRLATTTVKPNAVLNLAVGDVLSIPHSQHKPLELAIDGQLMGHAAVGANGARLACVVVSTES
jgi:flagellar motor switch protein FliM